MSDSPVTQLSLRGFDRKLDRAIRDLARAEKISRNKAALMLLRKGAGLDTSEETAKPKAKTIGSALDSFFGVWTKEEARKFNAAVAVFEQVDTEMWK